jgi:pyruvate/2-oxoglutarate dehydrogenase complex dihydrolipoamide dehydrogenase (E3) component
VRPEIAAEIPAEIRPEIRTEISADLCVIGAGSGGLSVAAGASQLGARTVLIERHKMGGDCLNYGCVPSKALLASAKAADRIRKAGRLGIEAPAPQIDFPAVGRHVRQVIAAIAPNDGVPRFEALGVQVIQAEGRFIGPDRVQAGATLIRARRFVIATGSTAAIPSIPGLDQIPYLTNETLFDLGELPSHLAIIGGGPIGLEMAQAHRRLGSEVTVIEAAAALSKDDPELTALLLRQLAAEGIRLHEQTAVEAVEKTAGGIILTLGTPQGRHQITASHLLIAAGRRPSLAALDLDKAGVAYTARGVTVDRRLRTTNRRIFAIGDAAAGPQFTHVAGYHAGIVIRNALFRWPAQVDYRALPWVTYTDPELAHVGQTEAAARQAQGRITVLRWPFHDNDRAQTEHRTGGLVKVITTPRGRILGCTILGEHAGELIQLWGLAIAEGLKIGAIANMIAPYPTYGEASKRAAGSFYTLKLFSPFTKRLVRLLARFG